MTAPDELAPLRLLRTEHYEQTDLGNAKRLVAAHGTNLRFVPQWGRWLAWDGQRWAVDLTGEIDRAAKDIGEAVLAEALDAKDEKLFRHGLKSQSAPGIRNMVTLAATEPGMPVLVDQLDADPMLLTVANGTVDLTSGKLRTASRDDLITKASPVSYNPTADCPQFLAFLDEVLPDPEVRDFVQRFAGYSLTGHVIEHLLLVFYGTGANGKSTLLRVLLRLLGEHAMPGPPRLLVADRHPDHPTSIASLHGRRLVVVQEIEEGARFNEALLKELTGGDRLTARYMRQDFWDFAPTHKFIIASNHKPVVRGNDAGIWRRLALVPFTVSVPADQQDPHLAERLEAELPGILNWAVDGCLAWQKNGLAVPDAVRDATDDYRREQDVIAIFLGETTIANPVIKVNGTTLYAKYTAWCGTQGITKPLSQRAFVSRLEDRGIPHEKDRNKTRWWIGIGLPASYDDQGATP